VHVDRWVPALLQQLLPSIGHLAYQAVNGDSVHDVGYSSTIC
jgi:hypothetical protein